RYHGLPNRPIDALRTSRARQRIAAERQIARTDLLDGPQAGARVDRRAGDETHAEDPPQPFDGPAQDLAHFSRVAARVETLPDLFGRPRNVDLQQCPPTLLQVREPRRHPLAVGRVRIVTLPGVVELS